MEYTEKQAPAFCTEKPDLELTDILNKGSIHSASAGIELMPGRGFYTPTLFLKSYTGVKYIPYPKKI